MDHRTWCKHFIRPTSSSVMMSDQELGGVFCFLLNEAWFLFSLKSMVFSYSPHCDVSHNKCWISYAGHWWFLQGTCTRDWCFHHCCWLLIVSVAAGKVSGFNKSPQCSNKRRKQLWTKVSVQVSKCIAIKALQIFSKWEMQWTSFQAWHYTQDIKEKYKQKVSWITATQYQTNRQTHNYLKICLISFKNA